MSITAILSRNTDTNPLTDHKIMNDKTMKHSSIVLTEKWTIYHMTKAYT